MKKRRFRRFRAITRLALIVFVAIALYFAYPAASQFWSEYRSGGLPPVSVEAADYNKARVNLLGREFTLSFGDVDLYARKLGELVAASQWCLPPSARSIAQSGAGFFYRGAGGLGKLPQAMRSLFDQSNGKKLTSPASSASMPR